MAKPTVPGKPVTTGGSASSKATTTGNKGGAVRGQARAAQVKARNTARKATKPVKKST